MVPGPGAAVRPITIVLELANSLGKKQQIDMAVLDFSKAFNREIHQRLAQMYR